MAQINWALPYLPQVHFGSTIFLMPLPIMTLEERFAQDFRSVKVPLQPGVQISGVSRGALTVSFSGIISKNTRSGTLHTKERMQDLFMNSAGAPFTFYRYYDSTRQNYRWYADCIVQGLSFNLSATRKFSIDYSMTVLVPSGKEDSLITTRGEGPSGDNSANVSGIRRNGGFVGDDDGGVAPTSSTLPTNRTLLYGPVSIKLTDSDGVAALLVKNSDGDIIFKVDSDGAVQTIQPIELVDSISWP